MFYSVLYLTGLIRGNLFLILLVSLSAMSAFLVRLLAPEFSIFQHILLLCVVFSIPLCGWAASFIVERNISTLWNQEYVSRFSFIIAAALCTRGYKFVDYILSAFSVIKGKSVLQLTALMLTVSAGALKCAAVSAFALLLLVNVIELPFVWFCGAFGFTQRAGISFVGLRPAAFLIILFYVFDILTSYIGQALWPVNF